MTRISQAVSSAAVLLVPLVASAHFKLNAPLSLSEQDPLLGDPQKTAPCGQDDGDFMLTNEVTPILTGSMLEISVTETIAHEGHFRISIANDRASLPDDPLVTGTPQDDCDATVIQSPATFPILADGLLPHTSKLPPNSKMMVQLPAGMQCDNCVIQVLQYMRKHGAPCFYHHCATVNISDTAPPPSDGGVDPGTDSGVDPTGGVEGGCCSTSGGSPTGIVLGFAVAALILRRRRRR